LKAVKQKIHDFRACPLGVFLTMTPRRFALSMKLTERGYSSGIALIRTSGGGLSLSGERRKISQYFGAVQFNPSNDCCPNWAPIVRCPTTVR
jgi:hypothetical protein